MRFRSRARHAKPRRTRRQERRTWRTDDARHDTETISVFTDLNRSVRLARECVATITARALAVSPAPGLAIAVLEAIQTYARTTQHTGGSA